MLSKVVNRITILACTVASELTKIFKFSFIVGSKWASFSLAQCLSPLVGFFGGITTTIITFGLRIAMMGLLKGLATSIILLYHIPTFCGALYLASSSKLIRIGIPLVCMAIFISHPIGSQTYLYSFYWFIPMAIAFLNNSRMGHAGIFMQALGSTFTTHAVGSVIWLYTHSLTASTWQMLISVVWAERLILALGMTVLYYGIVTIQNIILAKRSIKKLTASMAISNS